MVNNKILTFCHDNKTLQVTSYQKSTLTPHRTASLTVPQPFDVLQSFNNAQNVLSHFTPFSFLRNALPLAICAHGPNSNLNTSREPSLPILLTGPTVFSFSPSLSSLHHSFKHHTHIILLLLLLHLPRNQTVQKISSCLYCYCYSSSLSDCTATDNHNI